MTYTGDDIGNGTSETYNPAVFTSQDYFVLMPDIVYRDRQPGMSAVECVVPATEKAIQTGMIDPKCVGLVGHSWGAYQTAFIVTQTNIFSAAVAGALVPLSPHQNAAKPSRPGGTGR